MKGQKGITLIALVITIIVLLILAIVSIRIVINNGIIAKANKAVNAYSEAEIREKIQLAYSEYKMARVNDSSYTMKKAIDNTGLESTTVAGDETAGWTITVPTKDGDKVFFLGGDGSVTIGAAGYDILPEDFWLADEETKTASVNSKYTGGKVASDYTGSGTGVGFLKCDYTKLVVPNTAMVINEDGSTKQIEVTTFSIDKIGNITHLKISEGIETLPLFKEMTSLEEVIIPNTVTKISQYAFYKCTNLTNVVIPDSVIEIAATAFGNCKNLASIKLPSNLKSLSNEVFINCESLSKIEIPNSVTSIWAFAFSGCSSLSSITIPSNITMIDSPVFDRCTNLTKIKILKEENSISGKPWGAPNENLVVEWND